MMFDVASPGLAAMQSLVGAPKTARLDILVWAGQKLTEDLVDRMMTPPSVDSEVGQAAASVRMFSGAVQLFRFLAQTDADFVAFSLKAGILWDNKLSERIRKQIERREAQGLPWLFLTADGVGISGAPYASAHFESEPTLTPDRGCHCVVQTAGTLVVANVSSLRALGLLRFFASDPATTMNELVLLGYSGGYGSYFVSELFPCVRDSRRLTYMPIADQIIGLVPQLYLPADLVFQRFPGGVDRLTLLKSWVEVAEAASTGLSRLSFVVRSLFKRPYLIRRCLISIDYIRAETGFSVEIVIASDVDDDFVEMEINALRDDFPHLTFVRARGQDEAGHSRVRNLIAGIKATSGARVCVIDDDDFYTPQVTEFFRAACAPGRDDLVVFDTQIMLERWRDGGVKPHRELLGFGDFFPSSAWANTLRGWNAIPLCGIIHPGWFIRQVAHEYGFSFDYSEDFILHLHCLTHRCRPPITPMPGIGAYQSHRERDDNVSNIEDRTQWTLDTGNGLYELLFERKYSFEAATKGELAASDTLGNGSSQRNSDLILANQAAEHATALLAEVVMLAQDAQANLAGGAARSEMTADDTFDNESSQIKSDLILANQAAERATAMLAEVVMLAQDAHENYVASKPSPCLEIPPSPRGFSLFGRGLLSRTPRIRRAVNFVRQLFIAR